MELSRVKFELASVSSQLSQEQMKTRSSELEIDRLKAALEEAKRRGDKLAVELDDSMALLRLREKEAAATEQRLKVLIWKRFCFVIISGNLPRKIFVPKGSSTLCVSAVLLSTSFFLTIVAGFGNRDSFVCVFAVRVFLACGRWRGLRSGQCSAGQSTRSRCCD